MRTRTTKPEITVQKKAVKLSDLTPEQRRLVLALIEAQQAQRAIDAATDEAEKEWSKPLPK